MLLRHCVWVWVVACVLAIGGALDGKAQVNTATLSGVVTDPQGLPVHGAKVMVINGVTGAVRDTVVDDEGRYVLVGLPPGQYKLLVDGGANFASFENSAIVVSVGENASFSPRLELRSMQQTVTVTSETAAIETTKTEVSQVVDERRIDNLPINGRSYINFTLTNSQTTRDVAPTIGPAPNSGLNIGGSRARSNMVSVDGADAVDNSINGIRSTVSQEAVQEFQLILSNYNAEYGRATGGVVNIVTKSGGNQFHGDLFGYVRNKSFQARSPFSGQVDPTTGTLDPVKQAYTRVQTGLTFGGPLKKDKTFYFFSYEYTQREETGFSSIGTGNFGMTTGLVPCIPIPLSLTSGPNGQLAFYQGALGALTGGGAACSNPNPAINAEIQGLSQAAVATGAASNVALNANMNVNTDGTAVPLSSVLGIPAALGSKFFPGTVNCPLGTQVNSVVCLPVGPLVASGVGTGLVPLPASYVGLNSLRGNFPIMEKTSLWSLRLDQRWNNRNNSFLRVGVSPSLATGDEPTSQNQVFGQNAGSRTGVNQFRDLNVVFQHDTIVSDSAFNEFRFQGARRGLHFGFSQLPGGDQIGVNIPGYAYFGREPYSPVDRIEKRYEFTDFVTLIRGKHSFKFGGDANLIQLRSSKTQIFQLDFGGDVNFGTLTPFGAGVPGTTGLQSYGLGVPITYIQGIGSANSPFDNLPFAFFAQDSWRATRKLTINYGVRYDVEVSPLFAPATPVNAAAEQALGVIEGIPRNNKNVAPRFGIAWDPAGNGKTVIRAGYGLFYDHPLLAVAFDSATADGGRSVQLSAIGGTPSACGLIPTTPVCGNGLDLPTNLNGATIFQGVLNALPNMGYLPNQQRFDPFFPNSLFANQNYLAAGFPLSILPFTLPVDKNFKYGYAQQANLTVEREIAGSWKISAAYQWTRGVHLNRSVDITSTDPQLLAENGGAALATGLVGPGTNPLTVVVPGLSQINAACPGGIPAYNVPAPNSLGNQGSIAFATPTGSPLAPGILGLAYSGPSCGGTPLGFIGTPAVFNFFRSSGPNPSFAGLVPGGYNTLLALAGAAGYPLGPKNSSGAFVPIPFNFVDAQRSIGNSFYNALTVNVTKRFSHGFEMLSSYTWSHSVDDSTDLQSTLDPADPRFPQFERSNSVNDQRHRWVTSAVFQTAGAKGGENAWRHVIGDITLAPIVELASGRPFNIISGEDTRLDLAASQARPSVAPSGVAGTTSPYIPGVSFAVASTCLTNAGAAFSVPGVTDAGFGCVGNLGRNRFTMPYFFQWDMRIGKRIALGERMKLDLIADGFNLFNHTNISAVNQLCDPAAGPVCTAGQPSAAYDARQFQFALKLIW
jgi:hypothetical protein